MRSASRSATATATARREALRQFSGVLNVVVKSISNDAFGLAKRKAKRGHQDWLVWPTSHGTWACDAMTAESIRAALLAVGTQGKFFLVSAGSGHCHVIRWRQGVVLLRNAKNGY
jgi:hypothetical protein